MEEITLRHQPLKVMKGNLIVMKVEKIMANLYMLWGDTLQVANASVATSSQEEATMMWHHRLGHTSEQGLKVLTERNLLPGLKEVSLPFCEHCVISKQHKLKFAKTTTRSKHKLDLIHSDVWESPEIVGVPYQNEVKCISQFKEFKAQVELETGRKIKCLRTDNGGEYVDGEFLAFCKQEGIVRQFSVPHTPQQNGVAERMNRTLLERTRAVLRTTRWAKIF
ncbi:hypothetical protein CR513_14106, partial [Mucuna pruriens]